MVVFVATHHNRQSATPRQSPPPLLNAAELPPLYKRGEAHAQDLASDPLIWLTTGWRTKAMQWLIDGKGQREIILRDPAGKFASCLTPGQLVSVPDSYYGDGCSVFYHFSKTYIQIKRGGRA